VQPPTLLLPPGQNNNPPSGGAPPVPPTAGIPTAPEQPAAAPPAVQPQPAPRDPLLSAPRQYEGATTPEAQVDPPAIIYGDSPIGIESNRVGVMSGVTPATEVDIARANAIRALQQLQATYAKMGQADDATGVRNAIRLIEPSGVAFVPRQLSIITNPEDLSAFRNRVGQVVNIDVTGSTTGNVWGTGIYSDDSTPAAAAVHAGVLTAGQRGILQVEILPGQQSYAGSTSHDVTSAPYSEWPGSYRIISVRPIVKIRVFRGGRHPAAPGMGAPAIGPGVPATVPQPDPGTLLAYGSNINGSFTFDLVGKPEGVIWGDGVYTADSPLAVAAVHSGFVAAGQHALVTVTILPGRDQYPGSTRFGVTSQSWQSFPFSYIIDHAEAVAAQPLPGQTEQEVPGAVMPVPTTPYTPIPGGNFGTTNGQSAPAVPGSGAPSGPVWSVAPIAPNPGTGSGNDPYIQITPAPPAAEPGVQALAGPNSSIEVDIVGSTQGTVWGTDIYTNDSSVAAAAVHAGILHDGEAGRVRITMLPGQTSYPGSARNGVTSESWRTWPGSFRLEKADQQIDRLHLELRSTGGGAEEPADVPVRLR
jgi:hypothetical protein